MSFFFYRYPVRKFHFTFEQLNLSKLLALSKATPSTTHLQPHHGYHDRSRLSRSETDEVSICPVSRCPSVLTQKKIRSRNIALLSIFGVVGGTLLMFRLLAPQRGTLNTNEEIAAFRGGDSDQTDQGEIYGHTARPPRKGKGYQVPRGGSV